MESQQTALITGASRGIGAAIADHLAAAGYRVIGTATTPAGAEAIGQRLAPHGGEGAVLDIADPESITALVKSVGPVAVLVNNAGITRDGLLLRMKDEDWAAVMDTNLMGVFRLTRGVLRGMMKARFGRIVNVGSVVGRMGNPGQANYSAAKAGLEGFSRSLASEVGSRGITVNVVAPGFIETDMTRALPEAARDALLAQIPCGRLGQVDDIAKAVVYLTGPGGSYVTGTTIHVNGGLYMG